ncbi:serpin I2-like [Leucoraja erinacea]|uniref:serpin I2-like n=1 Tax=Leucoraja erinaceus TaxID=7782 RepID=UPI0024554017|nr:serpin I2-like [Leucoraja erinacea]
MLSTVMRILLLGSLLLLCAEMAYCSSASLHGDITMGFTVDLYHAVRSVRKKGNILCSPTSISVGLAMVALGGRGTTLQQLRKGLHFDKGPEGEEFSMLKKQSSIMSTNSEKCQLKLANALYIQDGYSLSQQYLGGIQEFFDNAVRTVNFQDSSSTANIINKWIANQTSGKVNNLVSSHSFSPLTKLVLVNAIYFKGRWKHAFNSQNTRLMEFYKEGGSVVEIPMMHQQAMCRFGYFTAGEMRYQVLELPYSGEEVSITLALPEEGADLVELERHLTPQLIDKWDSTMVEDEIEIGLPRFIIQQKLDLTEPLEVLNITEIFKAGADLSGMTESADLHISQAVHRAFIEINEEGSEAAASTGLAAAIMSLPRHQFMANHPFMFLIRSKLTAAVLFVGRLMEPEKMISFGRDKEAL